MTKPIVAIIGRQNVGKSTLLNRLAGKQISIVADLPGTTRDRIMADVTWEGKEFTLIDTGGLQPKPESTITKHVHEQVKTAIIESDVVVFLVDTKEGILPYDLEIADMLRQAGKPVVLTANKADSPKLETQTAEFYELGLGDPMPVSAFHGRGTAELLDKIITLLPASPPAKAEPKVTKVAIVGRPNVGKSALLNALLGEERAIVDDTPGTTRDATDTLFDFHGQNVLLIDTAGIRRRGQVETGVEQYSVLRSLRAIDRADIALLVIDATEPFTAQDMHVGGYIRQMAKGVIIVVNKWDLVTEKDVTRWKEYIDSKIKFMPYASVVYTSARFGQGMDKIMPLVLQVYEERFKRLPTAAINSVVQQAVAAHNPPHAHGTQLRVLRASQTGVNPPSFVFSVNDTKLVHFSYQRYLENRLRQVFGFAGTPIRLTFKNRGER